MTRRTLVLVAALALAVTGVAVATLARQPSARSAMLCTTSPAGWKQRPALLGPGPGAASGIVLTNFRFGRASYDDGLVDNRASWPHDGIMLEVIDWGSASRFSGGRLSPGRPMLQRADLRPLEGFYRPAAFRQISYDGLWVTVTAEFRAATPTAFVAANRALSAVHTCSA